MDSLWIDGVVKYFDVIIGICLIFGLLTRFSAIAAALFLLSVVLTQMPGFAGSAPTYYQFNMMLALLVIAATGAGRYGGLDFFLSHIRLWWNPPTQGNRHESNA